MTDGSAVVSGRYLLRPEASDRFILGEWGDWAGPLARPMNRALVIAVIVVLMLSIAASLSGVMIGNGPWVIGQLFAGRKSTDTLQLDLFGDPFGGLLVLSSVLTPCFTVWQARFIARQAQCSISNGALCLVAGHAPELAHLYPVPEDHRSVALERTVESGNRQFDMIGRWPSSVGTLALAVVSTVFGLRMLNEQGLFSSQITLGINKSNSEAWGHRAYDAWWASINTHPAMACLLGVVLLYFFYAFFKELLMGAVVTLWAARVYRLDFHITPNMLVNTDGYHGLRQLRDLARTTYAASFLNQMTLLFTFAVVLDVRSLAAIFFVLAVMIIATEVAYGTVLIYVGIVRSKQDWVEQKARAGILGADAVWDWPNLPFKYTSLLSALGIYLLMPALLVVLAGLFKIA